MFVVTELKYRSGANPAEHAVCFRAICQTLYSAIIFYMLFQDPYDAAPLANSKKEHHNNLSETVSVLHSFNGFQSILTLLSGGFQYPLISEFE